MASRESDPEVRARTLTIMGRNVTFAKTAGRVADVTFAELCERPLGAADYVALAHLFHTILIRGIPVLGRSKQSAARRFITAIDTFYDARVRLLFSADVEVERLFQFARSSDRQEDEEEHEEEERKLMDDLGIRRESQDARATASMFRGEEELFATDRTVSRISEMQSLAYWDRERDLY